MAEADAVYGAYGMGYETIRRNLALLNVLWDGGEVAIDRRSKPSVRLRDHRLTFGLMTRPGALRGFLERAGTLPHTSSFIARLLIAWPSSAEGSRSYRVAPESMPAVERFGLRIRGLLDTPLCTHADGGLQPIELALSPPAHATWVQTHDRIKRTLAAGRHSVEVRDLAAKPAENAARLAALFHMQASGPSGVVDAEAIHASATVIGWHVNEARRLLSELDTPTNLVADIRLDAWLISAARRSGYHRIPTPRVYQFGPGSGGDEKAMKAALATPTERG